MDTFIVFNTLTGIGVIAAMALVISIWVLVFLRETNNAYFVFLKKHALRGAFLLALGGTLGSLIYSEVFGLPPCLFCWWQRVFLYPQVIVLGVGLYFQEKSTWIASIILSAIGSLISIYHIFVQSGLIGPTAACETVGVSCAKLDVLVFGWITIPIMCLTLFVGIMTFAYITFKNHN